MELKTYDTLEEAFGAVLKADVESVIVPHVLEPGNWVKRHVHADFHEYVILHRPGAVKVRSDKGRFRIEINPGQAAVIHFPPGESHGLTAITAAVYFVIRTASGRSIFPGKEGV
jgi:quercetin dioxygenase-like cupin family protein